MPAIAPARLFATTGVTTTMKTTLTPVRLLALAMAVLVLAGCSTTAYRFAGNRALAFGKTEMAPYLLTFDDVPMVCATAESLTPLLMTFEAVGANPDQMAVVVYMGAGLCSETEAFNAELRYLRAVNQGNADEAKDARVEQKRGHALAAKRQQESYNRFLAYYGDMPAGKCSKKLDSDVDELIYLLGMVSGVKALLNDVQSESAVNVTKDIPGKIAYWSQCVPNEKWWDMPDGMRAAVWQFVPMLAPEGAKPMVELERVANVGAKKGVRLGYAIWALAAWGDGDQATTRRVIREFAAAGEGSKLDPRYRMLDAVAVEIIQGLSDRLWTAAVGTRTPQGALGTFWDDQPAQSANIDDLL
jgi:hypothetical protein